MLSPGIAKIERLKKEADNLESRIIDAREVKKNLPLPDSEELARWEKFRRQYNRQVPHGKNYLFVVEELAKLAEKNNLSNLSLDLIAERKKFGHTPRADENSFSQGQKEVSAGRKNLLIAVTFKCLYPDLGNFLFALGNFSQIVKLNKMSIQKEDDLIKTDLILKAFYQEEFNSS